MRKNIEAYLTRVLDDLHNLEGGCGHLKETRVVEPSSADICEQCREAGVSWVSLRLCLECGKVACCDSSPKRHARQHYNETGHNIILSYEPRELWMYCFDDDEIYVAPE